MELIFKTSFLTSSILKRLPFKDVLNVTYKLLHNKGNHKQNEKTTYGLGENIWKWCDQQGLNFQNIQTAPTV